ncbi:MAG: tripartite tricarboxylate transporter TctB family protein [Burkholderiales bacterium]|nr:tripartite tricarboxylate transporter TctB family protein [Burkholderiales bacterium]MCJ7838560.1 tripartite tricarboxylate transporter TctB family protein [Burkholderiales bacterium]
MSEANDQRAALTNKTAELAVAGFTFALGAIVIFDSWRLGAKWMADGPQTGYFPFYVGLIICIASVVNFVGALRSRENNSTFVEVGQLKLVLSVLVPSSVYVALVGGLGIYVPSILYIAFFMLWLGKYPWWKAVLVSVGTNVFFYCVFEIWFKVPLPKGVVESLLGLD